MAIIEKIKNIFRVTDKHRHTGIDFEEAKEEHVVVFQKENHEDGDDKKTPHVNSNFSSVNIHLVEAGGKYADSNILSMPNPSGSMTSRGAKEEKKEELLAESKTNMLRNSRRRRRSSTNIGRR